MEKNGRKAVGAVEGEVFSILTILKLWNIMIVDTLILCKKLSASMSGKSKISGKY